MYFLPPPRNKLHTSRHKRDGMEIVVCSIFFHFHTTLFILNWILDSFTYTAARRAEPHTEAGVVVWSSPLQHFVVPHSVHAGSACCAASGDVGTAHSSCGK